MKEYHKIVTVWKRNPETKFKTLIENEWATPEFWALRDIDWVWTEKVDGTNIRIMYQDGEVRLGGKTDNAQIHAGLYNILSQKFHPRAMEGIFGNATVCLYGEGYGAKIQKGGGNYNPDGQGFVLFDVFVENDLWLERNNVEDIADKLEISIVPIVGRGSLMSAINETREGLGSTWGSFKSEGMVMRPNIELKNRRGGRIITKIKHKDF